MGRRQDRDIRNAPGKTVASLQNLWVDEGGLTTLEYAFVLALVALAGLMAWQAMGKTVADSAEKSVGDMRKAMSMISESSMQAVRPLP